MSLEIVLEMSFLTLKNADMSFLEEELTWRFYTIAKALPTIKQVDLINKKEFTKVALDENFKILWVHVVAFEILLLELLIYLGKKAQMAFLLTKKIIILDNYSKLAVVFSEKKALILLE